MTKIDEQQFRDILQSKLGAAWDRAFTAFRNYGPNLGYDVTNVLLHAADQGKVDEVLGILEEHYQSHLQYQHPEIRGTVGDRLLGVNPTQAMFLRICQQTLGLQPNPA
ncbi:MAG: hypothetical protein CEN89_736 [Candidatus Berkelbacteria bacterium Licking1014_7]|uniref:Uncharacterized protein n=1 Tax=Candidatus Berkelbacteria bacterium Licking1014_7 TaxID=2017147 RepID=A0A554LHN1_9BACT|nr:MAG: hypothetical protein CEN89_736 [Candidatus Berkelbacteria bacterium Licking1014_7]